MVKESLLEARRRRSEKVDDDEELLMTDDGDDSGVAVAAAEEAMLLQGDDNDSGDLVEMGEKEDDEGGEPFCCGDEAIEIMGSRSGRLPPSDSSFFP